MTSSQPHDETEDVADAVPVVSDRFHPVSPWLEWSPTSGHLQRGTTDAWAQRSLESRWVVAWVQRTC